MNANMNKGYWHDGWPIPVDAGEPRNEIKKIVAHAHRLRSRYIARVARTVLKALFAIPAALFQAVSHYWRKVKQPTLMDGDRLGFGNRR